MLVHQQVVDLRDLVLQRYSQVVENLHLGVQAELPVEVEGHLLLGGVTRPFKLPAGIR